MKSIARGSAIAAIATAFVLGYGTSTTSAQDAALGANAELAAKGVWDANITYAKDDVVTARGSAWISLKAVNKNHVPGQTSPSSAAWWRLFARGFSPLGAWVNTTKYQPDDLVTFNGQTYRAKVTNLNKSVANATFWELLVTKGANGAAGATGPQGPAGPNTGIGSGTSSAPSISFTGDPDTGIFHPSADKIALVEGGTLFLHNLGPSSNTALGLGALENTIESFNTAVGYHALNANSSGSSNAAFGDGALEANTNGVANTAIGSFAMNANKTGNWNTAVGAGTLDVNISGARNVAVGHHALQNSLTDDNTAIGFLALQAQTNGNSNTAVGATALTANTDGNYNVAVGPQALSSNQAGSGNVAIGAAAMISNTIGSGNLAVGGGPWAAMRTAATTCRWDI